LIKRRTCESYGAFEFKIELVPVSIVAEQVSLVLILPSCSLDTVDPWADDRHICCTSVAMNGFASPSLKSAVLWTGRKHGESQSRSLGTRVWWFKRSLHKQCNL